MHYYVVMNQDGFEGAERLSEISFEDDQGVNLAIARGAQLALSPRYQARKDRIQDALYKHVRSVIESSDFVHVEAQTHINTARAEMFRKHREAGRQSDDRGDNHHDQIRARAMRVADAFFLHQVAHTFSPDVSDEDAEAALALAVNAMSNYDFRALATSAAKEFGDVLIKQVDL